MLAGEASVADMKRRVVQGWGLKDGGVSVSEH
jgi:hypothetical protein